MLVDSKKLKKLRQSNNWTQQHLADVCALSLRTIQRVEKDGVASNETVAAYASVFETQASDLLITIDEFDTSNRGAKRMNASPRLAGAFVLVAISSFVAGVGLTIWLF